MNINTSHIIGRHKATIRDIRLSNAGVFTSLVIPITMPAIAASETVDKATGHKTTIAAKASEIVPHEVSHAVRFRKSNGDPAFDSLRIGFDELRACFPTELAALSDNQVLTKLIAHTGTFIGRTVDIQITPQINKAGQIQKNAQTGADFYNVRLLSQVHDLPEGTASAFTKHLFESLEADQAKMLRLAPKAPPANKAKAEKPESRNVA